MYVVFPAEPPEKSISVHSLNFLHLYTVLLGVDLTLLN